MRRGNSILKVLNVAVTEVRLDRTRVVAMSLSLQHVRPTYDFKAARDLCVPLAKSSSRLSQADAGCRREFDLRSRPIKTRVLRSHMVRNALLASVITSVIFTQLDQPRRALVYPSRPERGTYRAGAAGHADLGPFRCALHLLAAPGARG